MAKLVVLSEGLKGRSYELATVLTTVGRLEDNSFQIAEQSVSSHHCEILLRGSDVVVKDLNSTNGTFLNGQQITGEAVVRPGQVLRLGQVEVRLEDPNATSAAPLPPVPPAAGTAPRPPAAPPAAPAAAAKKQMDQTMVIPGGVKLNELDAGAKSTVFDKNSPFAKKSNKGTKLFIIVAAALAVILIGIIAYIVLFKVNE